MKKLETYIPESQGLLENNQEILGSYNKLPVPTKKLEDWKFYDTSVWFDSEYEFNPDTNFTESDIKNAIGNMQYNALIVFENGAFQKQLSKLTDGVNSLADFKSSNSEDFGMIYNYTSISKQGKFESLNTLCAKDGAHINVVNSKNLQHVVIVSAFSGANSFSFQRNIVTVDENAQVKITEIVISKNNDTCINNAIEILTAKNAQIEYTSIQKLSEKAQFVQSVVAKQEENSNLTFSTFPISGKFVRSNIWVNKDAEQAHTFLNGLFFPAQDEHFEIYAWANHNKPKCETHELFKGLAKDNGQGVFSGKVYVAKDAQETLATQSNKNILLSDSAKIHSKPQLEIYADDVSCSHGSTTGQINQEALWYMKARGISQEKATVLLLGGFIAEVTNEVSIDSVKDFILNEITSKI